MDELQKSKTNSAWGSDPDDLLEIVLDADKQTGKADTASPAESSSPLPQASDRALTNGTPPAQADASGVEPADVTSVPVASVPSPAEPEKPPYLALLAPPADYKRDVAAETTAAPMEEYYPASTELLPVEEAPQENWFALLVKETLETVVLAVVIFLLIRIGVQNYRIEGSSMEPNFQHGEYLLVNKLAYRLGEYERGDVIVFKYPGDTTKDYIKRVIGLPGDTVEIREGSLYVNGISVSEPYEIMPMNSYPTGPTVVEPGYLYVLGDNRPASSDTRDWGLLDQDLVIGQAWLAIYPIDQFGLVDHPELHFTPIQAQGP